MALQPRTAALFHREKGIAGRRVRYAATFFADDCAASSVVGSAY